MGNTPEKKFRVGRVSATIWKNTSTKDEKEVVFYSVAIEKNYTDKDDKWQTTSSYNAEDLPKVSLLSKKAYEYIAFKDVELKKE